MIRFSLVVLMLAGSVVGCGKGQLPTVEVKAKVYVDEKPFGPAALSLSPPTSGKDQKQPNSSGSVSADGTATLKSYPNGKGIVPGTYTCNLLPDPLAMNQVPMVGPVSIEIKSAGQTVDLRFNTVKNAVPGMVPQTEASGGAPATTTLAPL